jgi:hypothetical protein
LKVWLSKAAQTVLESLPDGLDKAQIRGVIRQLESEDEQLKTWRSDDFPGGCYAFAGADDQWKLTYHVVEMEEPVTSVVTITKRRTSRWALKFYPDKD